jgi:hypothetical protein
MAQEASFDNVAIHSNSSLQLLQILKEGLVDFLTVNLQVTVLHRQNKKLILCLGVDSFRQFSQGKIHINDFVFPLAGSQWIRELDGVGVNLDGEGILVLLEEGIL